MPHRIPLEIKKRYTKWSPEAVQHSCSGAFVYRLNHQNKTRYLKIQPSTCLEKLADEQERLKWLKNRLPVAEVIECIQTENWEYMVIEEARGLPACDPTMLNNPERTVKLLATSLKQVHSVSITNCPFKQNLEIKVSLAKQNLDANLVDEDNFDECRKGRTAKSLYQDLITTLPQDEDLVFTHGDYCLPNILFTPQGSPSFIDLARCGIADRWQDLALCLRSISDKRNFGVDYTELFLNEYGIKLDSQKREFYTLLDEFF